jgi:hypothetical protein
VGTASTSCRFRDVNEFAICERIVCCLARGVVYSDAQRSLRLRFTQQRPLRHHLGILFVSAHAHHHYSSLLISPRSICPCWPKLGSWLRAGVPQPIGLAQFSGSAHATCQLMQWLASVVHSFLVSSSSFRTSERPLTRCSSKVQSRL